MPAIRWVFALVGIGAIALGVLAAARPNDLYTWRVRKFGVSRARATPINLIRQMGWLLGIAGVGLPAVAFSPRSWS